MANTDQAYGFRPVKHLNGMPWNGQTNKYNVATDYATALFIGDVVKMAGSADADGIPTIEICGVTDVCPVGVIIAFEPQDTSNLDRLYLPASTGGYALICDDPDVVMSAQIDGAIAATDIGQNCPPAAGSGGSTTTGYSSWELDYSDIATTVTDMFQILRVENASGSNVFGANCECLCRFNVHQFRVLSGTTGI